MNESDSERLSTKLEHQGYIPVSTPEQADLIIINMCSVRQSAVNRVYSKIEKIREINKNTKIILTGCLLDKDRKQLVLQVDEIWPIIDFKFRPKHKSQQHAYLPIMNGCNNFCTYCAVPYTRDREISRPTKDILEEVKYLIEREYTEIILLGQNVNSYNFSSAIPASHSAILAKARIQSKSEYTYFPELLQKICQIPGNFNIKFLTSHPKDMSNELINVIAQEEKISKELHLPLQSGDNIILREMNRGYTVNQYKNLIKRIIKKIPEAKFSTDIIVGFPGETESQFNNTIKIIDEMKFTQIYTACYSPRPESVASKFKDNISSHEKKRRKTIILNKIKKRS